MAPFFPFCYYLLAFCLWQDMVLNVDFMMLWVNLEKAKYFKGNRKDKYFWILILSILAYMCNGGLFIEFEKLIPYSLECILLCLPLGLYILVFSFFLFNISTGEFSKTADDAVLHLEVLWNQYCIHKWNKQLWGMV